MAFEFIAEQKKAQQSQHRFRERTCISEHKGTTFSFEGKNYLNFSSNDYLGLNQHPEINLSFKEGIDKFGASACSSSLVTGYNYAHQALEATICAWLNKPQCILFNSGFAANSGVLNSLATNQTQFLLDKLSHASLIDGALSGKAKVKRFLHNNYAQLEQLLLKESRSSNIIISEGVFSMDGDRADVEQLQTIAKKYQAWLYLDDAHSIGVVGEQGQGSSSFGHVDIIMATFGKAIATSGAFVACDNALYDHLINFSRHYIYSTAISPAIAWASKKSIEIVQKEHWRREKIAELSKLFTSILNENITLIPTSSSIHAIVLGGEASALKISTELKNMGIWVTAIRPPTVANNTSRLRVTLCANHTFKSNQILSRVLK